jgi:hypothetical protein
MYRLPFFIRKRQLNASHSGCASPALPPLKSQARKVVKPRGVLGIQSSAAQELLHHRFVNGVQGQGTEPGRMCFVSWLSMPSTELGFPSVQALWYLGHHSTRCPKVTTGLTFIARSRCSAVFTPSEAITSPSLRTASGLASLSLPVHGPMGTDFR